jgi:4-hydroxymandelate oxidase
MRTWLPPGGSRRSFLRFLAGSPVFAGLTASERLQALEEVRHGGELLQKLEEAENGIASPQDALNVFDFETAARRKLPPAHFGYLATGVDDDATVRANRDGFTRYQIRVRRLVDVTKADTAVSLFGATWRTPIVLAPAASQKAFHPEGEVASARAARSKGHLQILSTGSNASVAEVVAARRAPVWFQLYPATDWKVTLALVKRAEDAGCPVLVLTVDQNAGMNRETLIRFQRRDKRECSLCHDRTNLVTSSVRRRIFDSLDLAGVALNPPDMTWDYVGRL